MTDRDQSAGKQRVKDEEGTVDQKIKDRIIGARDRVSERHDQIFTQARLQQTGHEDAERVEIWSESVREYLIAIEPLLRSDKVPNSEWYYTELPIADESFYPPDGVYNSSQELESEEGCVYYWSLFYEPDVAHKQAVEHHDHDYFDRRFKPPDPKPVKLTGLKDIIETKNITHTWKITTNPGAIPPDQNVVTISIQNPLKHEWLWKAVREADYFLHDIGVGVDMGHQQKDENEGGEGF